MADGPGNVTKGGRKAAFDYNKEVPAVRRLAGLVVLVVLLWTSETIAEETAFRNLRWGDGVEALGESMDITTEKDRAAGCEARVKVNEDYVLGPVTLTSIVYGFFQGRLMTIIITANDAKMLSQIARAKYGRPFDSNMFILNEFYRRGDTMCNVKEDIVRKTGTMVLASIRIMEEYERWQKEQAEAASKVF